MKTVPLYRPNRIQTGHAHDEIAHPPANALAARKQPAGKKQPVKKEASIGLSEEEKRSCHRTPGFAVASTGPPPSSTQPPSVRRRWHCWRLWSRVRIWSRAGSILDVFLQCVVENKHYLIFTSNCQLSMYK